MTAAGVSDGRDRILVVGNPYLGDTVLAVPVLRNLRRAFPGHAIDFLSEGGGAGRVLAGCPYVDEILRWERPPRPARANGSLRRRPLLSGLESVAACAAGLRGRRYVRAYLLKRSWSAALLAVRAGIPHRVGHASGVSSLLLTRAVRWRRNRHYADGLLDLLRADGVPLDDGRAGHWGSSPAAAAHVDATLKTLPAGRPRVFVAVRATDGRRQWPLDRWVDVLRRLVHDHRCEIVFCGGPDEARPLAALTADLGAAAAHAHDLSAAIPLEGVPALLGRMDLYLGINSGLMHLAAACGTPTVAVFDTADTVRWRPRGASHALLAGDAPRLAGGLVRRRRPAQTVAGWVSGVALHAISIDAVVTQAAAFLAARPAPAAPPLRSLDLRTGSHRYEVTVRSAAAPKSAVAEPARAESLAGG